MKEAVQIEWKDSQHSGGWQNSNSVKMALEQEAVMKSVGFMVAENDETVAIAQSQCGDLVQGVMRIPRACIVKISSMDWGRIILSFGLILTASTMVYMFMNPPERFIASIADQILQDVEIIVE